MKIANKNWMARNENAMKILSAKKHDKNMSTEKRNIKFSEEEYMQLRSNPDMSLFCFSLRNSNRVIILILFNGVLLLSTMLCFPPANCGNQNSSQLSWLNACLYNKIFFNSNRFSKIIIAERRMEKRFNVAFIIELTTHKSFRTYRAN